MLKLYFPRVENRVFERVWERVKFILMILCILGSFFYIVFNCQLHYNVDVEGQMPLQLIISDDMPKTFYIFHQVTSTLFKLQTHILLSINARVEYHFFDKAS